MIELLPWFIGMLILVIGSSFFSASEAALFSLRLQDIRRFESGTSSQQVVAKLLSEPDRLLSAVLFWNLVINMSYFAASSVVSIRLERLYGGQWPVLFAIGSLLAIIFFSEMVPKRLAVLSARRLTPVLAHPLAVLVRLVDPIMPTLRLVQVATQRLLWPKFKIETPLDVTDLERAVDLSSSHDPGIAEQEQIALRNIVGLSDIRVDEWMRPRTQFRSFSPPVEWKDLKGQMPPSGYLLITETDSEEIESAIDLKHLSGVPHEHLERYARPVVIIPWCASVAETLQRMRDKQRDVAAIVNEFGETIGILTLEDVLDTVFNFNPTRSDRILNQRAIEEADHGVWHVIGMAGLRRLARYFKVDLPAARSVTVAGVLQETLQRLPEQGDTCEWGPFTFRVLETLEQGHLLVELVRRAEENE